MCAGHRLVTVEGIDEFFDVLLAAEALLQAETDQGADVGGVEAQRAANADGLQMAGLDPVGDGAGRATQDAGDVFNLEE